MRELTKEEINNKPEWAVEYYIDIKDIWYVNKKWGMAKMIGRVRNIKSHSSIISDAKPIPRKEFDISEYLELDPEHPCQQPHIVDEDSCLRIDGEVSKFHAIGIAKHFKLTAEDLR